MDLPLEDTPPPCISNFAGPNAPPAPDQAHASSRLPHDLGEPTAHPSQDDALAVPQQLRQASVPSTAYKPRLFLDIAAGKNCPLSKALHALGGDFFAPFDFALRSAHDILDDRVMRLLTKLRFSGLVGMAWSLQTQTQTPRAQGTAHSTVHGWSPGALSCRASQSERQHRDP